MSSVTVTARDPEGHTATSAPTYTVATPSANTRIGLATANAQWSAEVTSLGRAGITVRRIYVSTLTQGGNDQSGQIDDALSRGMVPWVSFKLPTLTNPAQYQSWVATTAAQWQTKAAANNTFFIGTIQHEPQNDMTAAQFLAIQRALAPTLAAQSRIKVVPILMSWETTNPDQTDDVPQFDAYIATDLFANGTYAGFGFDSYESTSEGTSPYDRVPVVSRRLTNLGLGKPDLYIGEFNTSTTPAMQECMGFATDPQVKVACLWDNGTWYPLDAGRKAAFQSIKANSNVIQ